jgi:hypothetical protein
MDQQNDMELHLWEYIDGGAREPQKSITERMIAENAQWRARYEELLETHHLLAETGLEHPSMRFGRNVMEAIARTQITPAARNYINNRVIWGIAGFFIVLILGFFIYGFSQIDWSTPASAKGPGGIDLAQVDYSRIFDNSWVNLFLMMNIILGLFLLDRFLAARRRHHIENL